jgi:hypothetical protein
MLVGIRGGQSIKASSMRRSALPRSAGSLPSLPVVAFPLGGDYPAQVQPIAKIFAVRRLGDESCSPATEPSQCFLAFGIDIEDFLKVECVAVALVGSSSDAKEFPRPQAREPALENEQPGVARRRQCNSQHAPLRCMRAAKRTLLDASLNYKRIASKHERFIT